MDSKQLLTLAQILKIDADSLLTLSSAKNKGLPNDCLETILKLKTCWHKILPIVLIGKEKVFELEFVVYRNKHKKFLKTMSCCSFFSRSDKYAGTTSLARELQHYYFHQQNCVLIVYSWVIPS